MLVEIYTERMVHAYPIVLVAAGGVENIYPEIHYVNRFTGEPINPAKVQYFHYHTVGHMNHVMFGIPF